MKKSTEKAQAETWFVYILRCADGTLYTGIAKDMNRRCEQHNAGTASRYTRGRLPASVVYQEPQATRSLALKREAAIKMLPRRQKLAMIGGRCSCRGDVTPADESSQGVQT
ncbi:MAG: GIY-YIG nuclease family protein [Planctomycetes bacterium]|nr:GIY-YIG nuclease family protein [Planctomycetota bacterium]MBL7044161.1 GIY-YIG nuclease family protein [Pirellulaceae bacterium]